MPEGHTIHRLARLHRRDLAGRPVAVSSPQGRFEAGAAVLDGRTLLDTKAVGKHLFYRWDGSKTLYVHLGLIGKFRTFRTDPPEPSPATRLAMDNGDVRIYLTGPMICKLVDPVEEAEILAKLGPDPLVVGDAGLDAFSELLSRRRLPIGGALLDQRVVAGLGNVYRAEILFLCGIHPERPVASLERSDIASIWETSVEQLRRGEKAGRIVTVDPADVGASRRTDLARDERLYVYKRERLDCRRCDSTIERVKLGGRWVWFCPTCQPE